jgi:hypothetical protein
MLIQPCLYLFASSNNKRETGQTKGQEMNVEVTHRSAQIQT